MKKYHSKKAKRSRVSYRTPSRFKIIKILNTKRIKKAEGLKFLGR